MKTSQDQRRKNGSVLPSKKAGEVWGEKRGGGRGQEQRTGVRTTVDNGRGRERSLENTRCRDKTRGETKGGDAASLLSHKLYQFELHTPASENPCSHFGLHSLDVCFLFTTKMCHSWEYFK